MKTRKKSIGSFEAKTHLSNLLDNVQKGSEYIITKRGKPVARLVPYRDRESGPGIDEVLARFGDIRKSVKGKVNIREYIQEGRKY